MQLPHRLCLESDGNEIDPARSSWSDQNVRPASRVTPSEVLRHTNRAAMSDLGSLIPDWLSTLEQTLGEVAVGGGHRGFPADPSVGMAVTGDFSLGLQLLASATDNASRAARSALKRLWLGGGEGRWSSV